MNPETQAESARLVAQIKTVPGALLTPHLGPDHQIGVAS